MSRLVCVQGDATLTLCKWYEIIMESGGRTLFVPGRKGQSLQTNTVDIVKLLKLDQKRIFRAEAMPFPLEGCLSTIDFVSSFENPRQRYIPIELV